MKKSILVSNLVILMLLSYASFGQVSSGLDGDHFSLEGALDVFKNSSSIEDFEKRINEEDSYVNNLDLNEDGNADYIKVIDNMEGDLHAIVLQVDVSESESQDIAVIEIEKTGDESAVIQIIGDDALYEDETYFEPFEEEATNDGKGGPSAEYRFSSVVVNVWFWPSVQYIYRPAYRPWVSPWRWRTYPTYWKPWRVHPFAWHYNKRKHYHVRYHRAPVLRVHRAHKVYTPKRRTSTTVVKRKTTVVKKGRNNSVVKSRTTTKKKSVNRKNNSTTVKKKKSVRKSKRKGN